MKYQVKLKAQDDSGEQVSTNIDIYKRGESDKYKTVASGDKEYFGKGDYVAKAVIAGKNCERMFHIEDAAKTVVVSGNSGDAYVCFLRKIFLFHISVDQKFKQFLIACGHCITPHT